MKTLLCPNGREKVHLLRYLDAQVARYDQQMAQLIAVSEPAQRLMAVAGIGPLTATALVASMGEVKVFHHGRQLTAWLGWRPANIPAAARSAWGVVHILRNR